MRTCLQTDARLGPLLPGWRPDARLGRRMSATDSHPAAVLLDALGTLVALEPPAPRLRAELAARFGLEVSEDEAARAICSP